MANYHENLLKEEDYLKKTLELIKKEMELEAAQLTIGREKLKTSGRNMWEDSVHYSNDFEKMTEVSQYLSEVASHTGTYRNTARRLNKYGRMIDSPYFGRFDFIESGFTDQEKIYVGLYNLKDSKTQNIMVYDWRAPISSIFYRFEPGKASYQAPFGEMTGEVLLKRQYKIKGSVLKYFFDCTIRINDEILQDILGRNSSVKMRNIVETIQKEQDIVIRDLDNELLIVQGAAGSGKTSIALHRVAFLLYEGIDSKLGTNNIIIISPNMLFSKYISGVLPELGEENVMQTTVEEIMDTYFDGRINFEHRNAQLESVINSGALKKDSIRAGSIEFKGSQAFKGILDRFLWHYEHKLHKFEDIYYNGIIIEDKQSIKNSFLNNKIAMPMAKRLKRIEGKILDSINPMQKIKLEKIMEIVSKEKEHEFELKAYSRLLSIKDMKSFTARLHKLTEVDYFKIYKKLFEDRKLFFKLTKGLELPDNIEHILNNTILRLDENNLYYEDAIALLYMKLKIDGNDLYSEIRQVVIDEAQDYYPMHYEVFKLLFRDARYTVMGDICQTIEKSADYSLYDRIESILSKRKTVKLFLNKTYRASYEINMFSQKLLAAKQDIIPFERYEGEPEIVCRETEELLQKAIIRGVEKYIEEGFESIAIICKTSRQAYELYNDLSCCLKVKLLNEDSLEIEKGVVILPVYSAKGLEFDAVIVYGTDRDNYSTELDRRLMYIACTRALHRLGLYYTGEESKFLKLD